MAELHAQSARQPHIVIVGAGLGGLFLAQFLRKKGISYDIYERDVDESSREQGWAIGLHMLDEIEACLPNDLAPLRSACHLLPLDLPSQVVMHTRMGRIGVEDGPESRVVRVHRAKLRRILAKEVNIHWDKRAVRIEDGGGATRPTVWFQDGTSITGNLVVGADGTWSKVREHILQRPNAQTLAPAPIVMIHGETTLSGTAMAHHLRLGHSCWLTFNPSFTFFAGLNQVQPDARSASYYWFLYLKDASPTDPTHWLRTASRQVKYEYVMKMIADLDPSYKEIIELSGPDSISDSFMLYYDAIIEELPVSRVTLLGDAAHPITPFRGEGGVMAISDAMHLSNVLSRVDLSDDLATDKALDGYQREMTSRGAQAVRFSRSAFEQNTAASASASAESAKPCMPVSWGHTCRPMPEKPLGFSLD